MKILGYKIVSGLGAVLWFGVGVLILYSITNGTIGIFLNLIIGLFFCLAGYYLYGKSREFTKVMARLDGLKDPKIRGDCNRFFYYEIVFATATVVTGLVLISAVISRAFFENLPIFG